jgi:hypothetical protein
MENGSTYYKDNNAPSKGRSDSFYNVSSIDETRWNQYWPYELKILILDSNSNTYKATPWRFTLPIAPQDLILTIPVASSVQATLNGVVEKHGGAPFRDIVISGTTGITPIKNTAGPKDNDSLGSRTAQALFAGTVNAVNRTITSAQTLVKGSRAFVSNVNQGLGDRRRQYPK